jgi:hypothetical protein
MPPAVDAITQRLQPAKDGISAITIPLEIGAAFVGDGKKPRGIGGCGQMTRFHKTIQHRMNDVGARQEQVGRHFFDRLDDIVTMTGRLRNKRERNQTQIAFGHTL